MSRRLVLVTGASSGIGAALATIYAEQGWDLVITARREDRLEALSTDIKRRFGAQVTIIAADLADPQTPAVLHNRILAQGRTVDALVNNAGFGIMGGYLGPTFESHQRFLQIMQIAPLELTHRLLPQMSEQKFGRILTIASLAALLPGSPTSTLYGPVKAFMMRFSQGLHLEHRDNGVHVSCVCPGWTLTEFMDVASTKAISQKAPEFVWMGADEVARAAYEACEANRAISVPGAPNKFMAALLKILPEEWSMEIISNQLARLKTP